MAPDLDAALADIDEANQHDPNQLGGEPRALAEGRVAAAWIDRLDADPPAEVAIAARAHHLRRWEVPRDSYPEGRAGYLRWRRDQKLRHGNEVAAILRRHGYDDEAIERVRALLERRGLGHDPGTQLVEDAACLTFLELRYDEMLQRLDRDHLVEVVRKTLAKMSPEAIAVAADIDLSPEGREVLAAASSS